MHTISDTGRSVTRHFSLESDAGYSSHENSSDNNNSKHRQIVTHHLGFIKVSSPESEHLYSTNMKRGEYNITKSEKNRNSVPAFGVGGPPMPIPMGMAVRAKNITVQSDSNSGENYWKINFTIAFLPFILIGIPIHALILNTPKSKSKSTSIPRQKERFSYSRVYPPSMQHVHDNGVSNANVEVSETDVEAGTGSGSGSGFDADDSDHQVTDFIDKFGVDNNLDGNYWVGSLFRGFFSTCFTLLLLIPLTLLTNAPAIYFFYELFKNLVVLGEIPPTFVELFINFFYWLPFSALVNYTWIFGWQLRNRLAYFNSSRMHVGIGRAINSNFRGSHGSNGGMVFVEPCSSVSSVFKYLDAGTWNSILEGAKGCRVKMGIMYVIILAIHLIHFFIVDFQRRKEDWDSEKIWAKWLSYIPTVFFSLMLPAYSCFCWAILFQFQLLSGFIDALVIQRRIKTYQHHQHHIRDQNHSYTDKKGEEPLLKREFLVLFKQSYRQIAESILQVNRHFSIFISAIFVCVAFSMYTEIEDMVLFIVALIFSDKEKDEGITPGLIRSFVGQIFNLLLYAILAIFTIWQAVQVNDEAREFHVALNDIASESEIHANSHALSLPQNYNQDFQLIQAFRLLKNYVHSRMEQEKPALLTIPILFLVPGIKYRLTNYYVRH